MKRKFALLGHNISYSLSPLIHSVIYEFYGIDASYELISATEEELDATVEKLRGYDGFNVTKPHKINILRFLDEDRSETGSVNTVSVDKGRMTGYTTDGFGFSGHFGMVYGSPRGKKCLVLGAGGVARIIVPELIKNGAEVSIFNRTEPKAADMAAEFGCGHLSAGGLNGCRPEIVVNCTSCGLRAGEDPLPDVNLSHLEFVYDTIYSPPVTDLMKRCSAFAKTENGLGMLILQAIKADEIMLNIDTMSDINILYERIKERVCDEIAHN